MCILESVIIDNSQTIEVISNVAPYRVVNICRFLKSGLVCVIRLKHRQPLFGSFDVYLRVRL
jgi:hypothetical protein